MKTEDVTETLTLALQASGLDRVHVVHRPRICCRIMVPSYISGDLAKWLGERNIEHVRGAPCHPQTQGKIERWHQTLKNRILLENYYFPGDLEAKVSARSSSIITIAAITKVWATSRPPTSTSDAVTKSSCNEKGSNVSQSKIDACNTK